MKKWLILPLALLTIPAYGTEYQPRTTTQGSNHGGILSIGTLSILPGNQSGNRGGYQSGNRGGYQGGNRGGYQGGNRGGNQGD